MPEEYFSRQISLQKRLKHAYAPARGASTKSKAAARSSQLPWAQAHATKWETKKGAGKAGPLATFQQHFIKVVGRHCTSQQELAELEHAFSGRLHPPPSRAGWPALGAVEVFVTIVYYNYGY